MEDTPTVILTETGELQLTSVSRHCLLHAVEVLQPDQSLSIVLPKSGSHKIESFCQELKEAIDTKQAKGKKGVPLLPEDPLMPSLEIHRFCEGVTGTMDFMLMVEKNFLTVSKGNIDLDAFHSTCWRYYEMEKKSEISFPRWFSRECTYRLWRIYNCVLEPDLTTNLPVKTMNEVLKRLVEYCGYTWNTSYEKHSVDEMTFPTYLSAITMYFEQFKLEMSLTCEVIADMVDEIVNGVLKTGRLTKKGHKRKNWKTRWFVLQRTTLRYYDSRDKMSLKGQLVLNGNTEVKSLPDKPRRKFCFHVTCGHTGTPFEIAADDQRMKHEWILAIKKAIALARVMDGSSKASDFAETLQGFYLLKYGTPQPALTRQDSTVRKMKFHATMKAQRKRLSGRTASGSNVTAPQGELESSGEVDDSEQYVAMGPGENISSGSDSEDENRYVPMKPFTEEDLLQERNYDEVELNVSQSLPISYSFNGTPPPLHPRASRTASGPARTPLDGEKVLPILDPPREADELEEGGEQAYDPVCYDGDSDKGSRKSSLLDTPAGGTGDDGKEGSYILFTRNTPVVPPSRKDASLKYDEPRNWVGNKDDGTPNCDRPISWVGGGKDSSTDSRPSTSSLSKSEEFEQRGHEPNLYLTLLPEVRSSTSSVDSDVPSPTWNGPPAVPAHRKSSSPLLSPTVFSPTHHHRPGSDEPPPPIPPRYSSSPNLHRHQPQPPPSPGKRLPDSPRMSNYQNIKGSPPKPVASPRRSTMSPKHSHHVHTIKEEVKLKRVSSCDELEIDRNLSPPPIPPKL